MKFAKHFLLSWFAFSHHTWATEVINSSPSTGVLKMVSSLAIVLIVMAIVAWVIKRLLPSIAHSPKSVARIVGSVSLGSRERLVVVQVADQWLVVGIAPGQVNAIANLGAPLETQATENTNNSLAYPLSGLSQALAPSFAQWLQKASTRFTKIDSNEVKNAK